MSRKIAIVAKAGTSALAPWQDSEWEIWGLPWVSYPRVDRLFEIHSQERADSVAPGYYRSGEWIPLANALGVPVYCHPSRMHLFDHAIEYPFDAVMASLPIPFLETSISYQIALALHEGVDELGLYGVHMMASREYPFQRPSVTYLVGLAQGRGVKVTIAPGSPLFLSNYIEGRYGLSTRARFV